MMRDGMCPKCHNTQVFSSESLRYKSGTYNSNTIPLSFFRSIALDNYVCTECGYTESYIADLQALPRIKMTWGLVEHEGDRKEP